MDLLNAQIDWDHEKQESIVQEHIMIQWFHSESIDNLQTFFNTNFSDAQRLREIGSYWNMYRNCCQMYAFQLKGILQNPKWRKVLEMTHQNFPAGYKGLLIELQKKDLQLFPYLEFLHDETQKLKAKKWREQFDIHTAREYQEFFSYLFEKKDVDIFRTKNFLEDYAADANTQKETKKAEKKWAIQRSFSDDLAERRKMIKRMAIEGPDSIDREFNAMPIPLRKLKEEFEKLCCSHQEGSNKKITLEHVRNSILNKTLMTLKQHILLNEKSYDDLNCTLQHTPSMKSYSLKEIEHWRQNKEAGAKINPLTPILETCAGEDSSLSSTLTWLGIHCEKIKQCGFEICIGGKDSQPAYELKRLKKLKTKHEKLQNKIKALNNMKSIEMKQWILDHWNQLGAGHEVILRQAYFNYHPNEEEKSLTEILKEQCEVNLNKVLVVKYQGEELSFEELKYALEQGKKAQFRSFLLEDSNNGFMVADSKQDEDF